MVIKKRCLIALTITICVLYFCFDFWNKQYEVFVIISILSYLLSYKLVDYIADFRTVKDKSRIDIIFLTIFFILLFIPMMKIDKISTISKQENRTLARYKTLIKKHYKLNYNYGKDFEKWYNDRFFMRNKFIFIYNTFLLNFKNKTFISKNVIRGKDGWLFLGQKNSIESGTNSVMFTNKELEEIDNYLDEINKLCIKNNKKFYLFIAPDKVKIYEEYYNDNIIINKNKSRTEQLIKYIKAHSGISVIYPKETLLEHKKENLLYYKHDTHWTSNGALYGYYEIAKLLKEDFPDIHPYIFNNQYTQETNVGDLNNMIQKPFQRKPLVYKVPDLRIQTHVCETPKNSHDIFTCLNNGKKYNLLMYRDSFTTSLMPYLAETFKSSTFIWKYDIDQSIINKSDADIIIIEIVERNLPSLSPYSSLKKNFKTS